MTRFHNFTILLLFFCLHVHSDAQVDWRTYRPSEDAITIDHKAIDSPNAAFNDTNQIGKVEIHQPAYLDTLMDKMKTLGFQKSTLKGYRVQIGMSQKRKILEPKYRLFAQEFADTKLYYVYKQPNFRLRAGDFYTKLQAQQFKEKIKQHFPEAVVVMDKIELPKL